MVSWERWVWGTVAVLAVVGVGVAVRASGGGDGDEKDGPTTRREALQEVFDAATAGDVDALVRLAGTRATDETLECPDPQLHERTMSRVDDKFGAELRDDLDQWRGHAVEIGDFAVVATDSFNAGAIATNGCRWPNAGATERLQVHLVVDGAPHDVQVRLFAYDGHYYLVEFPRWRQISPDPWAS